MLGLCDGCSDFPVSVEGQMKKQFRQLAQDAGMATSVLWRDEVKRGPSNRQESNANFPGLIVQYPTKLNAPRRSNGRTAEFLVKLETENTELRHQAVELALQIQKLVESQLR